MVSVSFQFCETNETKEQTTNLAQTPLRKPFNFIYSSIKSLV